MIKRVTKFQLDSAGERFVPGQNLDATALEHWHRYALAKNYVKDKDVLDIASGEGYGSHYLSQDARSVIGVDSAQNVVEFARRKYIGNNIEFRHGSCDLIPIKSNSIDVVVSFETLEHHHQHRQMFTEIKRVLRPEGLLLMSTPDRGNYNASIDQPNSFHVEELSRMEFESLVREHFGYFQMLGQRMFTGSVIAPAVMDSRNDGKYPQESEWNFRNSAAGVPESENWLENSIFLIALASDQEFSPVTWTSLSGRYAPSPQHLLTELKKFNKAKSLKTLIRWIRKLKAQAIFKKSPG